MKQRPLERIHFITNDHIDGETHESQTEKACLGGIRLVQLRMKSGTFAEKLETAHRVRDITNRYKARLIVNDYVNIAVNCRADGVHVGKADASPAEARSEGGSNFIIGATANSFEALIDASVDPAVDYIGLGPYAQTATKTPTPKALGDELIDWANTINGKPVILIGGIDLKKALHIFRNSIYGVAVSSAITSSPSMTAAAEAFIQASVQPE